MTNNTIKNQTAIIVGASLAGLMTAIALAQEGLHVTVLEKADAKQRSGSGLQVDGGTFDMNKTARLLRKLASGGKRSIQLWSAIESRLRTEAQADPKIEIRYDTRVKTVDQNSDIAWIVTDKDETIYADILIGADGHRSMVREHVAPHHPDATYAGYIVWIIDTVLESDLPKEHLLSRSKTGVTMLHGINGFLFGSIIAGADGSLEVGKRRVGCAWYDNTRSDLLRELGSVQENVVHHSLKGTDIPEDILKELRAEATQNWPEPWLSATLHGIDKGGLTGFPIKEYVPDILAKGRIAIIGDAAHAPAPITASGFNESLEDAAILGKCIAKGIQGNDAINALEKYESQRLNTVRQMVQSGLSFSRNFGRL